MNDLDKQIRMAIKALIIAEYPTARVYAWNALSHDISGWAGMFRCSDSKTHGWIIKRASATATWKNATRDRQVATFDVWGFYGFRSGNETSNSDNEFAEILDRVFEQIKNSPRLGFENFVERHELLQFPLITSIESGEETLHFAQGRLGVHLCC